VAWVVKRRFNKELDFPTATQAMHYLDLHSHLVKGMTERIKHAFGGGVSQKLVFPDFNRGKP